MAVVEKKPEAKTASPFDRLAVASLAGVVYVLASLAVAFKAIPALWQLTTLDSPVIAGILAVACVIALAILGFRLLGGDLSRPGLRAGIFTGLVFLLLWALLSRWIGGIVEGSTYDGWLSSTSPGFGAILTAMLSAALGWWLLRIFLRPTFEQRMVRFEGAGWFNARTYKPGQGVRVRRGTILGVLLMAGSGIWVLLNHGTLERGPDDWKLSIPFTGKEAVENFGDAGRVWIPGVTADDGGLLPKKATGSLRILSGGPAGNDLTVNSTMDRDAFWKIVEPLAAKKKEELDKVIDKLKARAASMEEKIKAHRTREIARARQEIKDPKELQERIKAIDAGTRDPADLDREKRTVETWIQDLRKFGEALDSGDKNDEVFLLQRRIDSFVTVEQERENERRKERAGSDDAASRRPSLQDEMEWISQWARTDPLPVAARVLDRYTAKDINSQLAPERFRVVENRLAFENKDELVVKNSDGTVKQDLRFKENQRVDKDDFLKAVDLLKGKKEGKEAKDRGRGQESGPRGEAVEDLSVLRQRAAGAGGEVHGAPAAPGPEHLAGVADRQPAILCGLPDRHRGGDEQGVVDDAAPAVPGHHRRAGDDGADGSVPVRGRHRLGVDP